jgi:hypothetical protein
VPGSFTIGYVDVVTKIKKPLCIRNWILAIRSTASHFWLGCLVSSHHAIWHEYFFQPSELNMIKTGGALVAGPCSLFKNCCPLKICRLGVVSDFRNFFPGHISINKLIEIFLKPLTVKHSHLRIWNLRTLELRYFGFE